MQYRQRRSRQLVDTIQQQQAALLHALDVGKAADPQDVGGLAAPRRNRAQARHHQQAQLRSRELGGRRAQQRLQARLRVRRLGRALHENQLPGSDAAQPRKLGLQFGQQPLRSELGQYRRAQQYLWLARQFTSRHVNP